MLPPFASLIEAHGDELLAHARRLAGADAAEDVVQDALLRALRAYPRLRHADHLRAWLYRITTNAAMDRHRRTRREMLVAEPVVAATQDERDGFEDLIGALSERAQSTLRLRFVEDLEYEAIGARLDITPEAARQRVAPRPQDPAKGARMTPLSEALLESVAAEAVREGLADALYTRVKTPIGDLLVVLGDRGVVRVGFHEDREDVILADVAGGIGPRILRSDRELAGVRDALDAFFAGDGELDLAYDLRLVRSPFRRAVLETLAGEVHRGDTIRYGELAARIGHPRAARAAGSACATNPVPVIVPCHRVLPSTGGVGSYGGGPPRKRQLLAIEGSGVPEVTRRPRPPQPS